MARFWWLPKDIAPQQIIELYEQGHSAQSIITQLNLSCSYVPIMNFLRDQDVSIRRPGKSGSHTVTCAGCGNGFVARFSGRPSTLCLTCAPDKSWRQRFDLYGITKPRFDELYEKQSGLCDLCELPLSENISEIFIDHCHKQGHVRGLLHPKCNAGLHFIEDDKFLAAAVRYIERHRK